MYAETANAATRTVTVTTTLDGVAGSLRQAILEAQPGDSIVFSASAFNISQTVQLAGQIEISKSLTIDGSGASIATPTLSGNGYNRIFQIDSGVVVTLNRLNLVSGACSCEGGAIYVSTGASIVMQHATLFGNGNTTTVGGAIFNKGTVSLSDTSLTNNSASYGGAIRNYGTLSANHVIIAGNSALFGGAIRNSGDYMQTALLVINNSAIYNNSATQSGGGIHNVYPASVVMTNTTLYDNSATMDGGAIWNGESTELRMVNTTVYANAASGNGSVTAGGGITSAGQVSFINSIISGNTGGNCAVQSGTVADLGGNIEDANTCELGAFIVMGSRTMVNPLLGAFGVYQPGSIPTVALLRGSMAINGAIDAACPLTDARGVLRPQGVHCDAGAYEAFANYTFVPLARR